MIDVRLAETADAGAVLALAQSFGTSFVVEEQAFYRSYAELLATPYAHLTIVEAQGQVVGYLLGFDHETLYANGRVAWVEELCVDAAQRRKGLGRQLIREFENWASARGCRLAALATRRAASFYQSIGYEESAVYFRRMLQPLPEAAGSDPFSG